jgi:hypothetical protein
MFELLLPDPTQIRCDHVSIMEQDRRIFLKLTANAVDSACPVVVRKRARCTVDTDIIWRTCRRPTFPSRSVLRSAAFSAEMMPVPERFSANGYLAVK